MPNASTMVDPSLDCRDRGQGMDPDHRQSLHRDSPSNITPLEEHDQDQDNRDLHDIIRNRDAHDQIKNRCQEQDCVECE
jgi:hypothetical protein